MRSVNVSIAVIFMALISQEIARNLDGRPHVAGLEVLDLAAHPSVEAGSAWNGIAG